MAYLPVVSIILCEVSNLGNLKLFISDCAEQYSEEQKWGIDGGKEDEEGEGEGNGRRMG